MTFVWVAVLGLLGMDRYLKYLALQGADWSVPGFRFVLFQNDQGVFSIPTGSTLALWLMAVGTACMIGVVIHAWIHRPSQRWPAALMVIGAVSNVFDRLRYGFVIDWAYLGDWWPIFNLADVMIVVGLVWYVWSARRLTRVPH